MKPMSDKPTKFECANPILSVADMARSLRYYVEVLGFSNAEWGGDEFTYVTRDLSRTVWEYWDGVDLAQP